ncbi:MULTISPECIES: type II toxin-antitoxin system VapC family toxin [unclassified Moorena]|uniref:type II toxin-antitoxin system VapC family toxin n=1 Tax=unclassified Moorena TaxID=2683338 RepID=UPI0013BEDF07|nr:MULTISPECIES: type II toxin-antitoxin system VapC family toxin [unclassified Moorena]NEP36954.1 type II toxin-antitoxin system VapC family toxin [Moorena sp. SIO3B2]NEQ13497.1 type II toxin-antitoxin system VapC family toxin [Moorena sp. SIO3E2]NES45113.1 type II toxin-antitoxin system VapC family toxin [Moorena sp. SIO2C4]
MAVILIDTDILIDLANNDSLAKERLVRESKTSLFQISIITKLELIVGCRNKQELDSLDKFLRQFSIIQLNAQISLKAEQLMGSYYLSHGLLIPDALIAATAIENQIPLLSKNQRDYRFISELNLLKYP